MNNRTQERKYGWDWSAPFLNRRTTDQERARRASEAALHRAQVLGMSSNTVSFPPPLYFGTSGSSIQSEETKGKVIEEEYLSNSNTQLVKEQGSGWGIKTKAQGIISNIYPNPTGNCQIQCISSFMNILALPKKEAIEVIAYAWNNSQRKTELLVDIPESYCNKLEAIFSKEQEDIILKAPYINNTKTLMCIYLVQVRNMLDREGLIIENFDKLQSDR